MEDESITDDELDELRLILIDAGAKLSAIQTRRRLRRNKGGTEGDKEGAKKKQKGGRRRRRSQEEGGDKEGAKKKQKGGRRIRRNQEVQVGNQEEIGGIQEELQVVNEKELGEGGKNRKTSRRTNQEGEGEKRKKKRRIEKGEEEEERGDEVEKEGRGGDEEEGGDDVEKEGRGGDKEEGGDDVEKEGGGGDEQEGGDDVEKEGGGGDEQEVGDDVEKEGGGGDEQEVGDDVEKEGGGGDEQEVGDDVEKEGGGGDEQEGGDDVEKEGGGGDEQEGGDDVEKEGGGGDEQEVGDDVEKEGGGGDEQEVGDDVEKEGGGGDEQEGGDDVEKEGGGGDEQEGGDDVEKEGGGGDEQEVGERGGRDEVEGGEGIETKIFSDPSDRGQSCRENNKGSPWYDKLHFRVTDKDEIAKCLKEFDEPYNLKKIKKSIQVSGKGQSNPMFSSKPKPLGSQTTPVFNNTKSTISIGDTIVNSPATISSLDSFSRSSIAKVYYPSRDGVEVNNEDLASLEPEGCLSSGIMAFYIRYLQQELTSSSQNCHFFTTFFYNKLSDNCNGDAFSKLRKWWKNVNLFEKAYIFVPVNQNDHWSLAVICNPEKEDEKGEFLILHMDSLKLHNSSSIFCKLGRFLEELSYQEKSEIRNQKQIILKVPQQKNGYDCGLFVLSNIEHFLRKAPERLTEKRLSRFSKQGFPQPEEVSKLRLRMRDILLTEFKKAEEIKAASLSPNC